MGSDLAGILFDKDGTLIDYAKTWMPINFRAADHASRGDPELRDELLRIGGQDPGARTVVGGSLLAASNTEEIAAAWRNAGARDDGDLVAELDAIFTAGARGSVPVCDLPALFDRLRRRGLTLGVATSDSAAGARATLETLGLDPGALYVAGYDSGHGTKPGPGMALGFARHAGSSPDRILVVGDNLHDLHMGRAAGCRACVGVLTGTGGHAELSDTADHVIESIAHLEDLLEDLEAARP